jgi:hypothetical protein
MEGHCLLPLAGSRRMWEVGGGSGRGVSRLGQSSGMFPLSHGLSDPIRVSPFGSSHMALPLPARSRNTTSIPLVASLVRDATPNAATPFLD